MAIGTPYAMGENVSGGVTSLSAAITTNNNSGDCLAAFVSNNATGTTISGVSDPVNGSWTAISVTQPASLFGQWFIMPNASPVTTSNTVTATFSATSGVKTILVIGVPGVKTSSANDANIGGPGIGTNVTHASSASPSSGSMTLGASGELVLAGLLDVQASGDPTWTFGTKIGTDQQTGTGPWSTVAWDLPSGTTDTATATITAGTYSMFCIALVPAPPSAITLSDVAGAADSFAGGVSTANITLSDVAAGVDAVNATSGIGIPYVMCQGHAAAGAATLAESVVLANATGDTLFALAFAAGGTTCTGVSDPVNGAWTAAGNPATLTSGTANQAGQWFVMSNAAVVTATTNITAAFTGTAGNKSLSVFGCAGLSGSVDVTPPAVDDASTTSPSIASGTLNSSSELVVAYEVAQNASGTPVWQSPFTQLGSNEQSGTGAISTFGYDLVSSTSSVTAAVSLTTAGEAAMTLISLPAQGTVFFTDQAAGVEAFSGGSGLTAITLADVAAGTDLSGLVKTIGPPLPETAGAVDSLVVSGQIVITFTPPATSAVVTGETAHEVTAVPQALPPASPVFVASQMPVMYLQNLLTGQWLHRDVYNVTQPQVTWNLNAPGTFAATLTPPVPSLLDSSGNPVLDIWQTACYLEEASEIRFGGILTEMDPSGPGLALTFTEFNGYASGMPYEGPTVSKTNYDAFDAVRYIWNWLQLQNDGNLGLVLDTAEAGQNVGNTRPLAVNTTLSQSAQPGDTVIHIWPLPAGSGGSSAWTRKAVVQIGSTVGVIASATTSTITLAGSGVASYQPQGSVVGLVGPETPYTLAWYNATDCAQEIASIQAEVPFDFWERHSWTDSTKTAVRHRLHLATPRMGARRTDLRFAEGENIIVPAQGNRPPQNTTYANNVVGMGAGQGQATVRQSAAVRDGRLRRTYVYQDQTIDRTDRLRSRVAAILASVQHPDTITQIQVINHPNAPFGTFQVGDDILPILASGWRNISIWSRITQIQQDPTTQVMTIGLARSDSYAYVTQSGSGGTV